MTNEERASHQAANHGDSMWCDFGGGKRQIV